MARIIEFANTVSAIARGSRGSRSFHSPRMYEVVASGTACGEFAWLTFCTGILVAVIKINER